MSHQRFLSDTQFTHQVRAEVRAFIADAMANRAGLEKQLVSALRIAWLGQGGDVTAKCFLADGRRRSRQARDDFAGRRCGDESVFQQSRSSADLRRSAGEEG